MKLANALSMLDQLREILAHALPPTLAALRAAPSLLLRPRALSQLFFAHVWALYADGMDENSKAVKEALIAQHAHGVVLDLGAGHGHTALYLPRPRVTHYIALEPNARMHAHIRAAAARAGFAEAAGTLRILPCCAEDTRAIIASLAPLGGVDTLVAVRTLCCIPRPAATLRALVRDVLRPGGELLFYEHVASTRGDVRFWQGVWTPVWRLFFGGCHMDRPTDRYIRALGDVWEAYEGVDGEGGRVGMWGEEGEPEPEEHLFPHVVGRLVKRGE